MTTRASSGGLSLLTRLAATALFAAGLCLAYVSAAKATAPAPSWTLESLSAPTNFAPGDTSGHYRYVITATNDGGGAMSAGNQITITDTLPQGMTVTSAGASICDDAGNEGFASCNNFGSSQCPGSPGAATITCTDTDAIALQPGQRVVVTIPVNVPSMSGTVTNSASVSGGFLPSSGVPISAKTSEQTTIGTQPASFGIHSFGGWALNSDGTTDTQAGDHPFEATTGFELNTTLGPSDHVIPVDGAKDISVALPPGFVGDPTATPQCTAAELLNPGFVACPTDSQVGVVTLNLASQTFPIHEPVYNMVPPAGMPAEFGFFVLTTAVFIDANVRTGGDYGLTATVRNAPQAISLNGSWLTFWGSPSDSLHNSQRCNNADLGLVDDGVCTTPHSYNTSIDPVKPFLTLPTSCNGPQPTTLSIDPWEQPGAFQTASFSGLSSQTPGLGGQNCGALDFSPTISVQPDTTGVYPSAPTPYADSPAGLNIDLHIPQNPSNGLAEANLENTTVTLPPGLSVSPSAADGLGACAPDQIGLDTASEPTCPDSSKLGTVEVDTPVLPNPLTGAVYLAQQENNPFGSTLALYIAVQGDGVLVKLAGEVTTDANGQLVTTFDDNPQLPFSDFKLDFFGGPRGALMTPEACGTYTTSSSLAPWSGVAAASPSDSFTISSGCVSGFAPTFTAGVTNTQAGAYTPFVLSFSRGDGDEELGGLTVSLPPGLLANVSSVPLCPDVATAVAGNCTAVGNVTTAAGPGPDPFFLTGSAYLTGPYASPYTGASGPYGLIVVVPVTKVGPFNLGAPVVVRQVIEIDPTDAHVTVVSDPFPTQLGVADSAGNITRFPLRVRRIDVALNPNFMVNPTSCNPMQISATITSNPLTTNPLSATAMTLLPGSAMPVSARFQVGGCQSLPFAPRLKMSLSGQGRTTSGHHPTLTSILSTPGVGTVNLRSASVTLPLSLALDPNNSQHVCAYAVAAAVHGGPVGCPANTIVGTATAVTPLLPQPETGNVYLVQGIRYNSQGQQVRTLPTLLIPLRGLVALDLRAQTSVNSRSALVTTFTSVPDVPVTSFTLTISGGSNGLLVITGLHRSICRAPQITSAVLGGQNGALQNMSVQMATPCGSVKAAHKRRHKHKHRKKHPH